jgi:hypothetical protein
MPEPESENFIRRIKSEYGRRCSNRQKPYCQRTI